MKPDILFYQQRAEIYLGILPLQANLIKNGYASDIIIEPFEEDPIKAIDVLLPKLIGISVFSVEHSWLIKTTKAIHDQYPDIPIIIGGIHAQLYSQEILRDTPAALVCNSDGEEVLPAVLKELNKNVPDWSSIAGISYKDKDGTIHENERHNLFQYADEIIESRELYYRRYPALLKIDTPVFLSARGCPYSCSFCYNAQLKSLFGTKGKYIRRKSAENFINEIKYDLKKHNVKTVVVADDLFTYDKEWLTNFLTLYKKEISLPFTCSSRANLFDEETAQILSESGCITVAFGIETGNEKLRKGILNKNITNTEIIRCGRLLNKYKINSMAFNMFCLPEETIKEALETISINISAKIKYAFSSLLIPLPGTVLADICKKEHLIPAHYSFYNLPSSYFFQSILAIKNKREKINIHYLTYWFVRYPILFKLLWWVVYIKQLNGLLYYCFILGLFFRIKSQENRGWLNMIRASWKKRHFASKSFS